MVLTKVKKYTVANNELNLKTKNGLYCFLPFERIIKDKGVFKVGMTTQEYASRIENYHTYFPEGLYLCFFLTPPRSNKDANINLIIREMETLLLKELKTQGAKQLYFSTRKNQDKSEWFYASFRELENAFEAVQQAFKGSTLKRYNANKINKNAQLRLNSSKDKYVGEIVFFV
jgi:hypothetical protein